MKPAGTMTEKCGAARGTLAPWTLVLAALLLARFAEASLPRPVAMDGAALRVASLAEPSRLAPLAASDDIERFTLFAGDELAPEPAPIALASRVRENRFSLRLGADAFDVESLRGPPELGEDLCQGDDGCLAGTRIGGLELSGPFFTKGQPRLTLDLQWACSVSSCGLADGKPLDPWGLCGKRGEPPCSYLTNEQTGGEWLAEKYEAGWNWLLEETGGNYANREWVEIASGLNMFRGLRLFGATKYVGQRALSATGKFLDRMPVDAREFSPSAFGVGNLRLEEKAAEKTVRGVNLAQAKQVQPKPPGVEFKAPRGGGGDEAARAYAYQVTGGAEKAIYVNGTEFEGVADGILIDAKRAKGLGSWYDISGADRFTANVKIPDVIAQARRQLGAIRGTEFKGIRWVIADPTVANQIQTLFWQRGIPIDIVTAAPK